MNDGVLGSDLAMDLNGYVLVDETGDLALVSGTECLRQNLLDRLLTSPGELVLHPDYGAGLAAAVSKHLGDVAALKDLVRKQILRDPRVASVDRVDVVSANRKLQLEIGVTAINGQRVGNMVFPLGMESL